MSRKKSTRQLIGIDDIKNGSVVTADGELAFYFVRPSNLNVLPEQGVRAKVQELLGVLKGMAELELLALDSKESFQDNRQFYRQRLEEEDMPAIRGLLVQDRQHLDSVQTTMASSREFCFVLRRRKTDGAMNYAPLEQDGGRRGHLRLSPGAAVPGLRICRSACGGPAASGAAGYLF